MATFCLMFLTSLVAVTAFVPGPTTGLGGGVGSSSSSSRSERAWRHSWVSKTMCFLTPVLSPVSSSSSNGRRVATCVSAVGLLQQEGAHVFSNHRGRCQSLGLVHADHHGRGSLSSLQFPVGCCGWSSVQRKDTRPCCQGEKLGG